MANSAVAGKTRKTWMFILLAITLVAVGFYVNQLINGLEVTGLNNLVSWGLYIITFAFLVGLSAGGLIVSSSAYVLKIEKLKQVAPIGIVVAVACVIGAAIMIAVDMGRPERVINIILGGSFTSPIKWDFLVITIYLLIGLYECWIFFGNKWKGESLEKRESVLAKAAIISLPVAILVHSITAWIFGLQVSKHFWNTALMAPIFISSAVVSGTGLLLVIAYLGRKKGIKGLDDDNVSVLVKILAGFILLDLFFFFCELFTVAYAGGSTGAEAAALLLTGTLAPLFWFEIIVGMLVPLFILTNKSLKRSRGWVAVSGILVMVAVFLKRINIVLPGFLTLNMADSPGISTGRFVESTGQFFEAAESPFSVIAAYAPTLHEVVITTGILALVGFVILYGVGLIEKMDAPASVKKQPVAGGATLAGDVAK